MSDHENHPDKYSEMRNICKDCIDLYILLYQLKVKNEEELNLIFEKIKTVLIDSKKLHPKNIIEDILNIVPYNNRYTWSYLKLAKLISDEYHVKKVGKIAYISNFLFYKEYGIKLYKADLIGERKLENIDILEENTIYRAIMNNDLERFIFFTEREEFNENQHLYSKLYPYFFEVPLLELCCYYGAVDCFKFLRTKFSSEITQHCLESSFLGGNQEIMSECLKYKNPDNECMRYAIISHNIDFVTFLMNEYNLEIDLDYCEKYKNLESFLVYFDQTNDIYRCPFYSMMFNIPPLCEYFLSHDANINEDYRDGKTLLHYATDKNFIEIVRLLLSHGANINEKDENKKTVLHYATLNNNKEFAELLLSNGADINEKDKYKNSSTSCSRI
ncbi:hypothetical protein TVAG_206030 [Trichomonas vaginalis G3]|uniref:DUF3447 domain-containing protein n=1 Tax=Trichomonas vaginalis (strain ATCC PRA-98 / G3) TaxID=412133 RepID=A2E1I8_TRIV3|nr:proteasome regulatory particle assembly [Trichomonas vaginalis G3]EAY13435.1 hypothetical protein TVAG_206030 [Trichomonas vaginalis G3]KAI5518381.1 proteasome regulatory particle assembly [Trichomonas vaginalis G3]|eukprot:XP_001325658.1 hypothetical protein [Trichomonas vaginalis G3]